MSFGYALTQWRRRRVLRRWNIGQCYHGGPGRQRPGIGRRIYEIGPAARHTKADISRASELARHNRQPLPGFCWVSSAYDYVDDKFVWSELTRRERLEAGQWKARR